MLTVNPLFSDLSYIKNKSFEFTFLENNQTFSLPLMPSVSYPFSDVTFCTGFNYRKDSKLCEMFGLDFEFNVTKNVNESCRYYQDGFFYQSNNLPIDQLTHQFYQFIAFKSNHKWINKIINLSMNERTNERTDDRTNERTKERMNEWTNERMNEWTNERMNEWTNERMNE